MSRAATHHGIDQIPVIGQQKKSLRVLVQSSGIGDTDRIFHNIGNLLVCKTVLFRTDNSQRLIVSQYHLLILAVQELSVYQNLICITHLHSIFRAFTVHQNSALLDQAVSLPSGADPAGGQIFV